MPLATRAVGRRIVGHAMTGAVGAASDMQSCVA
jgi:hypothetical protein